MMNLCRIANSLSTALLLVVSTVGLSCWHASDESIPGVDATVQKQIESLAARQEELNASDKALERDGYLAGTVNRICSSTDGANVVAIWRQRPRQNSDESMEGGVYRSSDQGNTWIKAERGLPNESPLAYDLIKHPQSDTIYLATAEGVYRSEDFGASWNPVAPAPQARNSAWFVRVTLDPASGSLYAREVNDGYGVHMLAPNATEWVPIGEGVLEHWSADDVAYCPADNAVYVVTGTQGVLMVEPPEDVPRGIYSRVLRDGRFVWQEEKGLPVMPEISAVLASISSDPNGGEAWASIFQGLYHKSGDEWKCELNAPLVLDTAFEIGGAKRVVAWTMDAFYLKSDGAWSAIPTPWDRLTSIRCAAFCGDTLFVGTNRGLYSTNTPAGGEWRKHSGT